MDILTGPIVLIVKNLLCIFENYGESPLSLQALLKSKQRLIATFAVIS